MEREMNFVLRHPKILVHCPFCGRYLLTISYGEAEKECRRCKNKIVAILDDAGFRLCKERREKGCRA